MNRRKFFGASVASALAFSAYPLFAKQSDSNKQAAFRIVHLTDMHIYPDDKVKKGMDSLLADLDNLSKKPDFILNTGDNVMDSLKRNKEEVQKQWDAWQNYFRDQIAYPVYSCIGNHDVWGWGMDDSSITNDPLYGKSWALKNLHLKERYYSFEHKGWKFICLDSPYYSNNGHGYTAKLDDEQFDWLKTELKNTNPDSYICIASHIPVLSSSVFFDGNNSIKGNWNIPGAWMHIDATKIKDLLFNYSNVKASISGHIHMADKTEFLGVNYHCNGAVSGGWWKGNYHEFAPAYAIIDFYEDGSISTELKYYSFKQ